MKRLLPLLLAAFLLFGCAPVQQPQQTPAPSAPTDPSAEAALPTQSATSPAEPTTPPEISPSAPTQPSLPVGWFEEDGERYYRLEDGSLATGALTIDGVTRHFTSTGAYIVVVNPWNPVPEDYAPELVELSSAVSTEGNYVDISCYDAMNRMITDCNLYSGANVCVVSAYRSLELQTSNFQRKVNSYLDSGMDYEAAYRVAAAVIAVPGTSEHHLGLAADIVDTQIWSLVQEQENLTGQRWLMENCWRYGFIMRYPADKQEVTGIIYEPWHYRYVGEALAAELHALGITLEEYMEGLTTVDALPPEE